MTRFPRLTGRFGYFTFVLVLPFGIQPTETDSSKVSVGIFGGAGQALAIMRDCSGQSVSDDLIQFREGALGIAVSSVWDGESIASAGIRGGVLASDEVPVPGRPGERRYRQEEYVNPYLALEGAAVGAGLGVILPGVGANAREWSEPDPARLDSESRAKIPMSGHLRLGPRDQVYAIASLAENTPIHSGGGLVNVGLGYRATTAVRGFTGLSGGFYEQVGILQQVSVDLPRHPIQIHASFRVGEVDSELETGASVGLVYSAPGP